LKVAQAKERLWIHVTLAHQLSKTYRDGRIITLVHGIKWKCEGPFQVTHIKELALVQLNKLLYKWFTAMHSEGNPVTWPMVIEKA